ncbi:LmbU [Solihabitans fulvus]|uniref:LmbU n=1 Tax=Solihabitans fulvus TaxID=1892852 RepID=A0A5B2XNY9_9PSEU|nr:LmbU family transcriptional regulator [Solihabitans fulvus]KAA2264690.1 LmbU [Solihabitans fulvus]
MATRVGLQFPDGLQFEDWQDAGPKIFRVATSSAWCLGDWLVYGQERYDNRYRRAIDAAGLDYQTLRNYAWVARRFDISRRRSDLSFQHHAEVASLPTAEQDRWLDLAQQHKWSRNHLRKQLRGGPAEVAELPPSVSALPRLQVARERLDGWRRAAEESGSELEHWVLAALDRAAAQALEQQALEQQALEQGVDA